MCYEQAVYYRHGLPASFGSGGVHVASYSTANSNFDALTNADTYIHQNPYAHRRRDGNINAQTRESLVISITRWKVDRSRNNGRPICGFGRRQRDVSHAAGCDKG